MKNICFFNYNLEEGGIERSIITLANTLVSMGHQVDVILFNNRIDYPLSSINFNIYYIDKYSYPFNFIERFKIRGALFEKLHKLQREFDLFIVPTTHLYKTLKGMKLPNLYFCHHSKMLVNHEYSKSRLGHLKQVIRNCKLRRRYKNMQFITVSQNIRKALMGVKIQLKCLKTIYNPFNFAEIRLEAKKYEVVEQDYIIHVGRFSKEKRHDLLLHAYKKANITQKLLLIGNHKNEIGNKVKDLVKNLGLENKVIFKGFQINPFPYIKKAKMLVLSSDTEGFGMVLVEALILNTPVVSVDCFGPREILIDELEPFLSSPGDVNKLAENIKKMMERPLIIEDKYINKYSAQQIAQQYLELCK